MDARQAWDALRERFPRIEPEFVRGLNELVGRFDVGDRANRFVVGGVVEYVVAACFFSLDIIVLPRGPNQNAFDLDTLVGELRARFSVKSTFSVTASDIRLMNRLSAGRDWEWREPTIFVVHGLGMVYVDPSTHTDVVYQVRDAGDAYVLAARTIRDHARLRPDCLIACNVPINPRTGTESASRALFREIFDHPAYPTIGAILRRARVSIDGAPIMEYVDEVAARRDRGDLTPGQAQELIDAFVAQVRRG
jgi:hypothetical protein